MVSSSVKKRVSMSSDSINREQLLATLEAVEAGVSKKDIVEQSSCFAFVGGEVLTYNDEVACRAASPFGDAIEGAVPAGKLLELLRKIPDDEVKVTATETELIISRKGRKRSGLRMETTVLLPVDAIEKPGKWKKLPDDFADAVKTVAGCASNDASKFYLTCLHVSPNGWVEACDNFQICRWATKLEVKKSLTLKAQSLRQAAMLGADQFSEGKDWVHFKGPSGVVLSCRRYLEDYPDYTKWLAVKGSKAELPKSIAEAAETASLFSMDNPEVNLIRIYQKKSGEILVRGEGAFGWNEAPKPIKYDGPPLDFQISPVILADLVKRGNKCILSPNRLKLKTENYEYVTCLRVPDLTAATANGQKEKAVKKRVGEEE